MTRFDQAGLLDRLAARGELKEPLMGRLAACIADFHRRADVRPDRGGYQGIAEVVRGNIEDLESLVPDVLPADTVARLARGTCETLEHHRDLLERRRAHGCVRHCHGDLHLGNIVLLDDKPVMFDCLEFDEGLACTDTMYDLAFLLMDLCERDLRPAAGRLLTIYLELEPDDEGLALLPLFLSCRAAIRAKVHGLRAKEGGGSAAERVGKAEAYLRHAQTFLEPPPARLIAIGGFSGSGKSSLAEALAPDVGAAPGAVVLRSDRLRKRLLGVDPLERLSEDAYSVAMSEWVYRMIADRAERLLKAGHSVIADAVFAETAHRHRLEAAAGAAGVSFDGLWLDAPTRRARAKDRGAAA